MEKQLEVKVVKNKDIWKDFHKNIGKSIDVEVLGYNGKKVKELSCKYKIGEIKMARDTKSVLDELELNKMFMTEYQKLEDKDLCLSERLDIVYNLRYGFINETQLMKEYAEELSKLNKELQYKLDLFNEFQKEQNHQM